MWTTTVALSPMASYPQIRSYRVSSEKTMSGLDRRKRRSSYSLFFKATSAPSTKTRRASFWSRTLPSWSWFRSTPPACFSRSYWARWALIRATSTLGEKGLVM